MPQFSRLLSVLTMLAVLATACGSSGSGMHGTVGTLPATTSAIAVANCLNEASFLASPSGARIDGTSPAGVGFSLTFYKTPAAAVAAVKPMSKRTAFVVGIALVDFKGNASPAIISRADEASIRTCIDKSRK